MTNEDIGLRRPVMRRATQAGCAGWTPIAQPAEPVSATPNPVDEPAPAADTNPLPTNDPLRR